MTVQIDPAKVEQLAAQGLTAKQIADCCDISRSQFYARLKTEPDLSDALKKGRSKGVGVVTNALFQSAKGGNVTAQIFYLKNRHPKKWRDRRHHEHTGKDGKPIDMNWTVEVIEPHLGEPT